MIRRGAPAATPRCRPGGLTAGAPSGRGPRRSAPARGGRVGGEPLLPGRRPLRRRGGPRQRPRRLPRRPVRDVLAGVGRSTGSASTAGAIRATASDRAAPPTRMARSTGTFAASRASTASASPHSSPSTAARAMCAGVEVPSVRPCSAPVDSGLFGVRSPSRYGTSTRPPAPAGASRASLARPAWSTPSTRAAGVEHPRRVERAHQREVLPARGGEPGDDAGGVGRRRGAHRGHHAGRAERHDDVARPGAEAQRGAGVVAGARARAARRRGCARPPRPDRARAAGRRPRGRTPVRSRSGR